MIAVTFALPTESATFIKLLAANGISDADVRVVHTGVGKAACVPAIRQFLANHSPSVLVSSGFAGALSDELKVGDLVIAENYTTPERLERVRDALGTSARTGVMATADAITDGADDRAELARRAGAVAVDMETAWIANACRAASVPVVALRVVSDTPAAPLPAPPHVLFDLDAQRTNYARLASHVAIHPSSLLRFVAFGRHVAIAREKLAAALLALVRSAQ